MTLLPQNVCSMVITCVVWVSRLLSKIQDPRSTLHDTRKREVVGACAVSCTILDFTEHETSQPGS